MNLIKVLSFFWIGFIAISAHSQHKGFIKNENNTIHFKTYGKGEPLLIINGGSGMNSDGFQSLAKTLSNTNQVIIYDQRGTGQSKVTKVNSESIRLDLMISRAGQF